MTKIHWTALLLSGALCAGAQALEGDVPARVKDQITQPGWSYTGSGNVAVKDIVREYNRWEKVKVGIDSRLTPGRTVQDYKTENISILANVESLAKRMNAKVFAIRDFLYIATDLPDGIAVPAGDRNKPDAGKAPEPKRDEPRPGGDKPPEREKGPDVKKGDPEKPPPDKKQPKEKPPAAGPKPPAVGEKPLPALKPITPGSGLAELPAIFPGVRPGTSPIIPWSHKSMKDAAADGKPIILLSYFGPDPKKMSPEETKLQARFDKDLQDPAGFFETLILEDPEVQAELKGQVTFILIPWNEPADSWPAQYSEAAKHEGAALFVLPKDASHPIITWQQRNPAFTAKQLIAAVKPLLGKPDANKAKPEVAHADTKKPDAPPKNEPEKPKNAPDKSDKVKEE